MTTIGEINQKEECVVEWKVKDFFTLSTENDAKFSSPLFVFAKISWFLKLHPNEGENDTQERFIGLYLHRNSPGLPIEMEFTLGVKTIFQKLDPERNVEYIFKLEEGFGFKCFLSRAKVLDRKYIITSTDTLIFVCKLKRSIRPGDESKEISTKDKVLRDYRALFHSESDCDVIIRVKEREFPAHRIILSARSSVFESTFQNSVKKKRKGFAGGIVDVDDCEASTFSDFLCFLYCGNEEIITEQNVFNLLTAAQKFDVSDLNEKCLEFLKGNISVDTFCDTLTWALQQSKTELIKLTTNFFVTNGHKIVKTVKWQSFLSLYPNASNDLLIKAFESFENIKK